METTKQVVVEVRGGIVYSDFPVVVRDYDTEGMDESLLDTDEDGQTYHEYGAD